LILFKVIFGSDRLAKLRVKVVLDCFGSSSLFELGIDSCSLDLDEYLRVTLTEGVQVLELFTTNEKLDFTYTCIYHNWHC
jgi:hypothetical protein